jgi:preprotein translocase SecE subunit
VAKSRSARSSTTSVERASTNQLVQQWRALRSEISKVTWPTREEARTLTIAVTIGMVVMALFLYAVDAVSQFIIGGVIQLNIGLTIVAVVVIALLSYAFISNSKEI